MKEAKNYITWFTGRDDGKPGLVLHKKLLIDMTDEELKKHQRSKKNNKKEIYKQWKKTRNLSGLTYDANSILRNNYKEIKSAIDNYPLDQLSKQTMSTYNLPLAQELAMNFDPNKHLIQTMENTMQPNFVEFLQKTKGITNSSAYMIGNSTSETVNEILRKNQDIKDQHFEELKSLSELNIMDLFSQHAILNANDIYSSFGSQYLDELKLLKEEHPTHDKFYEYAEDVTQQIEERQRVLDQISPSLSLNCFNSASETVDELLRKNQDIKDQHFEELKSLSELNITDLFSQHAILNANDIYSSFGSQYLDELKLLKKEHPTHDKFYEYAEDVTQQIEEKKKPQLSAKRLAVLMYDYKFEKKDRERIRCYIYRMLEKKKIALIYEDDKALIEYGKNKKKHLKKARFYIEDFIKQRQKDYPEEELQFLVPDNEILSFDDKDTPIPQKNITPEDDKEQKESHRESNNKTSIAKTYLEYLNKSIIRWEAGGYKFDIDDKYFQETKVTRKVIPLSGVNLMYALKKEYPEIFEPIGKEQNVCNQRFWNSEERKQTCRLSVKNAQDDAFKKKIIKIP